MKDNLSEEVELSEDRKRIINLFLSKNYSRSAINKATKDHLEKYVKYVNEFIADPASSPFTFAEVGSILRLYADIEDYHLQYNFFSKINLVKFTKHLAGKELSSIVVLVMSLYRYLKKAEDGQGKKELIESIFNEIDLDSYIKSVNRNIQERWETESKDGYTSESDITLASVIRTTIGYFSRLSTITDDEELKGNINKKLEESFSLINFKLLGSLMEAKKKAFGSVRGVASSIEEAPFEKEIRSKILIDFLFEINFERLASSYNDSPTGNTVLANFCDIYSMTRENLSEKWKIFYENIFFHIPFSLISLKEEEYQVIIENFPIIKNKLEPYITRESDSIKLNVYDIKNENFDKEILDKILIYSGFNITNTTMLFQRLPQIFKGEKIKLDRVLGQFDFKIIGLRARGKKPKGVEQLFRRMSQLHLNKEQYIEFAEGLGKDECRRLLKDGCNHLLPIIKKCEFNDEELSEWTGIN